jgi:hypothetical protein
MHINLQQQYCNKILDCIYFCYDVLFIEYYKQKNKNKMIINI